MNGTLRKVGSFQLYFGYFYFINRKNNMQIDHIVYAVSDLKTAINNFEEKLGVRPVYGGKHQTFGTKNALINLDKGVYLELLAPDPDNLEVPMPRWMGVDLLEQDQITRWAIKTTDLTSISNMLKNYNSDMGKIQNGSRNLADGSILKWELTMPLAAPEIELIPFALDWSTSEKHPTAMLPPMNCKLINFYGTHPNAEKLSQILQNLNCPLPIEKAAKASLKLVVDCPNGIIEI